MSTFKCPQCGFVQGYATLNAHSGEVSDLHLQEARDPCPNDGAKLEPFNDPEPPEWLH